MNFQIIFNLLNSDQHFNKGLEVEVLKGYFKKKTFIERMYFKIRMSGYKNNK